MKQGGLFEVAPRLPAGMIYRPEFIIQGQKEPRSIDPLI